MNIGAYTLRTWGEAQAIRYLDGLETCCRQLADNPELGRACDQSGPACAAWNMAGMLCFTGLKRGAIVVSRILHQRMLPEQQIIDEKQNS